VNYQYLYFLGEILTLLGDLKEFWGFYDEHVFGILIPKSGFFQFLLSTLISLHHRSSPKERTNSGTVGAIGIYGTFTVTF
jgi:hypothetical protein